MKYFKESKQCRPSLYAYNSHPTTFVLQLGEICLNDLKRIREKHTDRIRNGPFTPLFASHVQFTRSRKTHICWGWGSSDIERRDARTAVLLRLRSDDRRSNDAPSAVSDADHVECRNRRIWRRDGLNLSPIGKRPRTPRRPRRPSDHLITGHHKDMMPRHSWREWVYRRRPYRDTLGIGSGIDVGILLPYCLSLA